MHQSVYAAFLPLEEIGGDLIERINAMGLHEIFEPIIVQYQDDAEKFNKVFFYMLHCYSRESDYHVQYTDWDRIKDLVAVKTGVREDPDLYSQLFHLQSKPFTVTIRQYMDYQGGKAFKHLLMLKDLYQQMVNSAIENIQDKDGVTMYDQKVKNAAHADTLYDKIGEWEQRMEGDDLRLNKPRAQLNEVEKSRKLTLRMEDNLLE